MMADRRKRSSLTLTFIVYLLLLLVTTESYDSWILSWTGHYCFTQCPANYFTSTYKVPCSDSCDTRGYSYYWCKTRKGWDYCSPAVNSDYKGNKCQNSCGDYGDGYNECILSTGSWSKCARVEPQTFTHYTRYKEKCIDDCQYHTSGDYFWCHTEKGWDYCSPLPHYTYRGESCRFSCGTQGYSYSWCYTSYSWNYCGIISPGECSHTGSYRRKRQTNNPRVICTRQDDDNNRKVTYFLDKGHQSKIKKDIKKKEHNEILDLINKWDNQRLSGQSRSNLIRSVNFRIDNQGMCNVNNQRCYNLQIQANTIRTSGQSTTVAQIIAPVGTSAEYMRLGFKISLMEAISVDIEEHEEPTSSPRKCCRRRKN